MTESLRVVKMKTLESRGRVGSATWCGTRSWKPAVASWQPVQIFKIWWLRTAVVLEPL
jgi:hypothetical protein